MIAEAGDYYVQFLLEHKEGGKELYGEAVSNAYLPERVQLDKESADLLVDMSFEEPPDEDSNYYRTYRIYYRTYRIEGNDAELREIANTAVQALAEVYEVANVQG